MRIALETNRHRWVWEWRREEWQDDPPEAAAQGSTSQAERAAQHDYERPEHIGFCGTTKETT